ALFFVRYDADPVIRSSQHAFDFSDGHVLGQLDRQRLAVAAHRSDANANAIDWNRLFAAEAQNFVRLRLPFPFFFALTVAEVFVDPRNKAAGEGNTEMVRRIG